MIRPVPAGPRSVITDLDGALLRFDRQEAGEVCTRIIADLRRGGPALGEADAVRVLRLLQRTRCFSLVQRVADAMVHGGLDRPVVRRYYAQALIDQEMPTAGLSILNELVASTADENEKLEAKGLIGLAYKRLYVATGDRPGGHQEYLDRAVAAYHEVYRADNSRLWHGINIVALLQRALRDGLEPAGFPDADDYARTVAHRVIEAVGADPRPRARELACIVEACVALNRTRDAQSWLVRYVEAADTDAFELANSLRQLTEVWQLDDDTGPGERLLPLLRANLLSREGGAVSVPASHLHRANLDELTDSGLERVYGPAGFHTLRWFRDALERCRLVARIEDEYGDGVGTGFLVEGSALHEDLPATVLLTSAHVIPDAIATADAYVTFRGRESMAEGIERYRIDSLLWSSPRGSLDVSVVSLKVTPAAVSRCPIVSTLPPLENRPHVLVIGHPRGRMQPMFSIQDNLMLDHDTKRIHYTAATDPGSSGSPAFDSNWQLIAMHHSGSQEMPRLHNGGTYQANEGIRIGAIREAIRQEWSGGQRAQSAEGQ
jgi:hypothetical protein